MRKKKETAEMKETSIAYNHTDERMKAVPYETKDGVTHAKVTIGNGLNRSARRSKAYKDAVNAEKNKYMKERALLLLQQQEQEELLHQSLQEPWYLQAWWIFLGVIRLPFKAIKKANKKINKS